MSHSPFDSMESLTNFASGAGSGVFDHSGLRPTDSPTKQSWGGKPYTGRHLNVKKSDDPARQPTKYMVPECKVFNMEDDADIKEYTRVMEKITNGAAVTGIKKVMEHRVPLMIYLEWYMVEFRDPKKS